MTRRLIITAAALTAINGMVLAQMGQSPAADGPDKQAPQTQQPSAKPAGGAMQGQDGQQGQQQALTSQEFVKQAASAGKYEVKTAKLIQDKLDDPQMKQQAQTIEKDHQKAVDELKQIAQRKNITWSEDMDAKHQRLYDQLKDQDQEQMAQTFKQQQIQAHKDSIQLFQRASTTLQDPELKQFAQKQLPILQQHLTKMQGSAQNGQDPSAQPAGTKLDDPMKKDKESGYESKETPIQSNP